MQRFILFLINFKVHTGFLKGFQDVNNTINRRLKVLIRVLNDSDYSLHYVGHSLGGALACLAATEAYLQLGIPELVLIN
jgi:alpha-beta hydrolase superfamily lysophospholipase